MSNDPKGIPWAYLPERVLIMKVETSGYVMDVSLEELIVISDALEQAIYRDVEKVIEYLTILEIRKRHETKLLMIIALCRVRGWKNSSEEILEKAARFNRLAMDARETRDT